MSIETDLLSVLHQLGVKNQETLENTPRRWAAWLREFGPLPKEQPRITTFENPGYNQMVYDRCEFFSLCEHHFLPIHGVAHIAYIPDKVMLGLSKLSRIVDYITRRPSTQETMTHNLGRYLQEHSKTAHVAVLIEAEHMCKSMRGVQKQTGKMITTYLGGNFRTPEVRAEFIAYTER